MREFALTKPKLSKVMAKRIELAIGMELAMGRGNGTAQPVGDWQLVFREAKQCEERNHKLYGGANGTQTIPKWKISRLRSMGGSERRYERVSSNSC